MSGLWKPSEGPVGPERFCSSCGKMKPGNAPGVISFHICNTRGDWRETQGVIKGELVLEEEPEYTDWFKKEWNEVRKQIESPKL